MFRIPVRFTAGSTSRNRVDAIDAIADKAEDVADELAIYAIKRTL